MTRFETDPVRVRRLSRSLRLEIDADEDAVMDAMKHASGLTSDANLIRCALWSLADHLQVEMPDRVFDLRTGSGTYRRNPRVKQSDT